MVMFPQVNEFRGSKSAEMQIVAMRTARSLPQDDYRETDALLRDLLILSRKRTGEKAKTVPLSECLESTAHCSAAAVLCRTRQSAEKLLTRLEPIDVCAFEAKDSRAYYALLFACPAEKITAPYRTVVLADGELAPGDAYQTEKALRGNSAGDVKILCAPQSSELKRALKGLRISIEQLRKLYLHCRQEADNLQVLAVQCGITPQQALSGLYILKEAGYIDFTFMPFKVTFLSSKGTNPVEVPLFNLINHTEEGE